jgi:hypothetical protein
MEIWVLELRGEARRSPAHEVVFLRPKRPNVKDITKSKYQARISAALTFHGRDIRLRRSI